MSREVVCAACAARRLGRSGATLSTVMYRNGPFYLWLALLARSARSPRAAVACSLARPRKRALTRGLAAGVVSGRHCAAAQRRRRPGPSSRAIAEQGAASPCVGPRRMAAATTAPATTTGCARAFRRRTLRRNRRRHRRHCLLRLRHLIGTWTASATSARAGAASACLSAAASRQPASPAAGPVRREHPTRASANATSILRSAGRYQASAVTTTTGCAQNHRLPRRPLRSLLPRLPRRRAARRPRHRHRQHRLLHH